MELSRNRPPQPKPLKHMLAQLTPEVIQEIIENEEGRWRWISEEVYGKLCADNREHLVVCVGQRFRFEEMVKRCQGYRRYCGKEGQVATHTLEQLCRASVLKALYNWSTQCGCGSETRPAVEVVCWLSDERTDTERYDLVAL